MAGTVKLSIVTPDRLLLETEASHVRGPGLKGEFGVLEQHTLALIQLVPGVVSYEVGGRTERLAIAGGLAEIGSDHISILADSAELPSEIDVERAKAARAGAIAVLAKGGTAEELEAAEGRRQRADARLRAVSGP